MARSTQSKHAVVFSGGGADGAYEVGVAKALFAGKCPSTGGEALHPEVFTGTSIGAFNAAFLVSRWDELGAAAVGELEKVWLERMASKGTVNGGYRLRLDPFELLDPRAWIERPVGVARDLVDDSIHLGWQGARRFYHLLRGEGFLLERALQMLNVADLVSAAPWEKTLGREIDYEKVRTSSRALRIIATNWRLGHVRVFGNEDMSDKLGPQSIRASSSVPGFYPVASVGSQDFVDGAVLMNTPLKPAIREGAEVLHVLYLNTDVKNMPLDDVASTLESLYRTQIISWAAAVEQDIDRVATYNDLYALGAEEVRKIRSDPVLAGSLETVLERIARHEAEGRPYRKLTVHRYFPPDGLDGALGFLDLRRDRVERLVEEGFQHTRYHDCRANRCILPDADA